tara:strand:+ start:851 stop:1072 length:222 start_codon:yes stop_codon:yes gene_type:complete
MAKKVDIQFDLIDFIQDDKKITNMVYDVIEQAMEEWLDMNGYEDWDVQSYDDLRGVITVAGVTLTPEIEENDF